MRIYAVHPISTYRTPYEGKQLARIAERFPDAEVVNPADSRWTPSQWQKEWPKVLPTLDAVVVFPDLAGYIGRGGYKEVTDAVAKGLPVHHLTSFGVWCESPTYTVRRGDWTRYARLAPAMRPMVVRP